MRWSFFKQRWTFFLATGAGMLFYSSAAVAAEKVVLKYSVIRMTIPVSELESFAETGKMSSDLEMLLGQAKQDPEAIRRSLTRPVKVNHRFLDRTLNSKVGDMILDEVGQVIHTPSGNANKEALRAALVLSASSDHEITLLETIKNYPTTEVDVEGDRLVEAYGKLVALSEQLGGVSERLQDLLNKIRLPRL
ncbi:MAG: alpha/beta hydrolase [Oscillatoriales cyanobacterium]|uniref:Alpha/beta hydrolase n=1 Tax=Microcoleus anatoxicus PTRS2 TaxID=2705321 RepID=A0ABU8YN26_9CYAN|nr:MAG: alpha/beta hydrolase [Oscillatoriales cyanobacterium]TAD94772.1 MAG: alpha/beta hydrolase [Oscillatoriales cyanobacterium]TAE00835.1 MAG: alpha/beta hydrolase [Oscillatoriales cyanobacterium]TAF04812.1 MAG: alpha/beta hydrolase [Oscillatoriales cyanobacterium]TAF43071.1 MAG: alpha/beta hydrolase [Oscillatoriales cyanobacterium]